MLLVLLSVLVSRCRVAFVVSWYSFGTDDPKPPSVREVARSAVTEGETLHGRTPLHPPAVLRTHSRRFRRGRCPRSGAKRNKYPWGASPRRFTTAPLVTVRRGGRPCPPKHRAAVSFRASPQTGVGIRPPFLCLRRPLFFQQRKKRGKETPPKTTFLDFLTRLRPQLISLVLPRERCAVEISPKCCIVSASLFAAAFALKYRRTSFYRG